MEVWRHHHLSFLHAVLGRRAAKAFADTKICFLDFSLWETIAAQRNDLNSCSLSCQHISFTLGCKRTFSPKLLSAVKIRCCNICLCRCWVLLERDRNDWKMEEYFEDKMFSAKNSQFELKREKKKCSSHRNGHKIYRGWCGKPQYYLTQKCLLFTWFCSVWGSWMTIIFTLRLTTILSSPPQGIIFLVPHYFLLLMIAPTPHLSARKFLSSISVRTTCKFWNH